MPINKRYGGVAILWMGLIFLGSTDLGATHHTGFLATWIRFLLPDIAEALLQNLVVTIRKTAHMIEYAVLCVLWNKALAHQHLQWRSMAMAWATAWGISALYAGLDEYHQSFVPSRTASLKDVGWDILGVSLAQIGGIALWGAQALHAKQYRAMQAFLWWFAWGIFSSLMAMIVLRGGLFSLRGMMAAMTVAGVLAGMAGLYRHLRKA